MGTDMYFGPWAPFSHPCQKCVSISATHKCPLPCVKQPCVHVINEALMYFLKAGSFTDSRLACLCTHTWSVVSSRPTHTHFFFFFFKRGAVRLSLISLFDIRLSFLFLFSIPVLPMHVRVVCDLSPFFFFSTSSSLKVALCV